jgi:hypothetical protein
MTTFISFARRQNPDSSTDSICTRCYQTIATGRIENDIAEVEKNHACDVNGEFDYQHRVDFQPNTFLPNPTRLRILA